MTVSDLFAVPATATSVQIDDREGAGTRARVRAKIPDTRSDSNLVVRAGRTVAGDWAGAWLWDADGLTIRSLWEQRIPDIARVPAENRLLWAAWVGFNHLMLPVIVPLLFLAWVLGHPARLLYLTPIAAGLAAIWLA